MKDVQDRGDLPPKPQPEMSLKELLQRRGVQVVDWDAYLRINDEETSPEHKRNPEQPREKITEWNELLQAASKD